MKKMLFVLFISALMLSSCSTESPDQEQPLIHYSLNDGFPQNCDTIWINETFTFMAAFSDNQELGSFSIEIHENFDHHSHSTDPVICELMEKRDPVHPFNFLQDFQIPEGLTYYEAKINISVPDSIGSGQTDEGDYDLFISLTDRQGWKSSKIINIKILRRPI